MANLRVYIFLGCGREVLGRFQDWFSGGISAARHLPSWLGKTA